MSSIFPFAQFFVRMSVRCPRAIVRLRTACTSNFQKVSQFICFPSYYPLTVSALFILLSLQPPFQHTRQRQKIERHNIIYQGYLYICIITSFLGCLRAKESSNFTTRSFCSRGEPGIAFLNPAKEALPNVVIVNYLASTFPRRKQL